jgi:Holliday junction DNA helicase RuvB
LKRVRDFAQYWGTERIDYQVAAQALDKLEVDQIGLDSLDKKILMTIIQKFDGGPVGIETLAASVGEEVETLEDVVEPFLLQRGFLQRTPGAYDNGQSTDTLAYLCHPISSKAFFWKII